MASKNLSKVEESAITVQETVDMLAALGIEVADVLDASEQIGDGWHVLDDKDQLINVPFVITDYKFAEGRFTDKKTGEKTQFVILRVVTREALTTAGKTGKWIVTDGSTGIKDQMGEWVTKKGIDLDADKVPALFCQGLTRSDYFTPDGDPAHTYYLTV